MSIEVKTEALDAKYMTTPDKNGLVGVITDIAVVITVTNTQTGRSESASMEVPLKWARPSQFTGIDGVTLDLLQTWAVAAIANNEVSRDYHERTVKELTEMVKKPAVRSVSMFGFVGETDGN